MIFSVVEASVDDSVCDSVEQKGTGWKKLSGSILRLPGMDCHCSLRESAALPSWISFIGTKNANGKKGLRDFPKFF